MYATKGTLEACLSSVMQAMNFKSKRVPDLGRRTSRIERLTRSECRSAAKMLTVAQGVAQPYRSVIQEQDDNAFNSSLCHELSLNIKRRIFRTARVGPSHPRIAPA
jgi:hypothetical protein